MPHGHFTDIVTIWALLFTQTFALGKHQATGPDRNIKYYKIKYSPFNNTLLQPARLSCYVPSKRIFLSLHYKLLSTMFKEVCRLKFSFYLWSSTVHISVFFLQILVTTFAHSTRAQLELNVTFTADRADTSGQDTASQIQAVNALASHDFIRRYMDPLDLSKYYIRSTDSAGNTNFNGLKCPNDLVFNQRNEQCTFRYRNIINPPILQFIEGKKCNGFQGFYCEGAKFTHCTEDGSSHVHPKLCAFLVQTIRV